MKAISIKNPYAQLIVRGIKKVEIRSFKTEHRGDILICASKTDVDWKDVFPKGELNELGNNIDYLYENAGHAIGIATIADCRSMRASDVGKAFTSFETPKIAFVLENPRMFKEPFPVTGKLGIFEVEMPNDVEIFETEYKL